MTLQLEFNKKDRDAACSQVCYDTLRNVLPPHLMPDITVFVELLGGPALPTVEFEDLLLQHPLAFRDYSVPPGFDFGKGWFLILKELGKVKCSTKI